MYCSHDKNNVPAYLHGFDLEADVVPLLGGFIRQILRLDGVTDLKGVESKQQQVWRLACFRHDYCWSFHVYLQPNTDRRGLDFCNLETKKCIKTDTKCI